MIRPRTIGAIARQAMGSRTPIYVHYFITHRCGLRCVQCNVPFQDSSNELKLDQVRQVAEHLKALHVGLVNVGGGEPMLRPELPDILRIFHEAGFATRLQTSAYWATPAKVDAIVAARVGGVSISLDSLDHEVEDAIYQRPGALKKILDGILLFQNRLAEKRTLCMLNCVISRRNLEEIPSLVQFAEAIGWDISLSPVHGDRNGGNPFRSSAPGLTPEPEDEGLVHRIFDELLAMKRRGAPIANSSSHLRGARQFLLTGKSDFTCSAGARYFLIRPNGGFSPCTDYMTDETLLREDFPERFHTPEFQAKMEKIARACDGCMYPCWSEMERFFWPDVLVERARTVVRRKKRLGPLPEGEFWNMVEKNRLPVSSSSSHSPLQQVATR